MCKRCHLDIFRSWEKSMHANSSALKNPLHGAFYQATVGDPRQEGVLAKENGKYPECLNCHAPSAALDKKTKLDAVSAYGEGVTCVACHSLKRFKGVPGAGRRAPARHCGLRGSDERAHGTFRHQLFTDQADRLPERQSGDKAPPSLRARRQPRHAHQRRVHGLPRGAFQLQGRAPVA
ncbi:MAG: cytochrome c family protein [Comamonadaceae bacterium]|nr:cytochrome c family protein [Comamonadaceae bacterium]